MSDVPISKPTENKSNDNEPSDIKSESLVTSTDSRISVKDKPLLISLFFKEIGEATFITPPVRNKIYSVWNKYFPNVPKNNWRAYLTVMEKEYYEKTERWNAEQLIGRITKQTIQLQEELSEATTRGEVQRISIVIEKITKSNELLARVNRLYETPAMANITITTSIDENSLLNKLNNINIQINPNTGEINEEGNV